MIYYGFFKSGGFPATNCDSWAEYLRSQFPKNGIHYKDWFKLLETDPFEASNILPLNNVLLPFFAKIIQKEHNDKISSSVFSYRARLISTRTSQRVALRDFWPASRTKIHLFYNGPLSLEEQIEMAKKGKKAEIYIMSKDEVDLFNYVRKSYKTVNFIDHPQWIKFYYPSYEHVLGSSSNSFYYKLCYTHSFQYNKYTRECIYGVTFKPKNTLKIKYPEDILAEMTRNP